MSWNYITFLNYKFYIFFLNIKLHFESLINNYSLFVVTKIQGWDMSWWIWLRWVLGLHTSAREWPLLRGQERGTYKTKDFNAQVSMWVRRIWENKYMSRCEGVPLKWVRMDVWVAVENVCRESRGNLILIVWRGSCGSLLIRVVTVM